MWQPNFVTTAKFHSKTPKFRKQQKSAHVFMENNTSKHKKIALQSLINYSYSSKISNVHRTTITIVQLRKHTIREGLQVWKLDLPFFLVECINAFRFSCSAVIFLNVSHVSDILPINQVDLKRLSVSYSSQQNALNLRFNFTWTVRLNYSKQVYEFH